MNRGRDAIVNADAGPAVRSILALDSSRSERRIQWDQLNQDGRLIAGHLIHSFGPAIYEAVSSHWPYHPGKGDGTVPINHVLRFSVTDAALGIGERSLADVRFAVVTRRDAGGALDRGWLTSVCDLSLPDAPETPVGRGEFWMALTRPFVPRERRRVESLPEALRAIPEFSLDPADAPSRAAADYRIDAPLERVEEMHVFHRDRTDAYRHVNTVVYLDLAADAAAKAAHAAGRDAGAMRFRQVDVQFRKPFLAGQASRTLVEYGDDGESFAAAVRFYPLDRSGTVDERVSTAVALRGVVAG